MDFGLGTEPTYIRAVPQRIPHPLIPSSLVPHPSLLIHSSLPFLLLSFASACCSGFCLSLFSPRALSFIYLPSLPLSGLKTLWRGLQPRPISTRTSGLVRRTFFSSFILLTLLSLTCCSGFCPYTFSSPHPPRRTLPPSLRLLPPLISHPYSLYFFLTSISPPLCLVSIISFSLSYPRTRGAVASTSKATNVVKATLDVVIASFPHFILLYYCLIICMSLGVLPT